MGMTTMKDEINQAITALKEGGVILYPTDTIWGLGCDATNSSSIEKLFAIKKRSALNKLIILLSDIQELGKYISIVPEAAVELINKAKTPTTIIYPGGRNLPKSILGEDDSVAIRITNDEFCNQLIREFGSPITSTSANISGMVAPASYSDIDDVLISAVDHVVDYGRSNAPFSAPSTIYEVKARGKIQLIRK